MSTETSPDAADQGASPPAAAPARAAAAFGLILAAIVGAEFLLQLDGTIVTVALPDLQDHLGVGVVAASWVPNAFLLAFGGLLLFSGRLGDTIGHRRVFLVGIGLITVASLVAGLAPNLPVLLVGRALQGAGAALAGPAGLALLTTVFEGERQAKAFGLYSTVTGLGAAAGMILGAVLTHLGDWRWSLLVNVPVGLVILVIALRTLGVRGDVKRGHSLGLPSAVLATGALVLLVFGLVGAAEAGWGSTRALLPLAAGVVAIGALVAVDRKASEPLLPGRVFALRARAGSFVVLLLLASVLTGFLLYLVQFLQVALKFTPLQAGLGILPFGLALLVVIQFGTPRLAKVDIKVRGLAGLALVLVGVLWLTGLDGADSYAAGVLGPIIVLGLGVGLAIVPVNMVILTTSAPEDIGITSGLLQTSLTIGGVFGVAILLVPYTGGAPGDSIGTLFVWSSVIVAAALVVAALTWFGGRKPEPAAAG
ncbi:MFS transporter [Actinokineospora auranticolor]|uniref:EmrB/QacA subfamily drug resistance transporter n=1 Tax=Actinokineospora auranticolor TaxID=155976 RepID=A0A2S6H1R6_9PSEU|nr:MFS transporter [Actinokineospora auranticolor]PPK71425.1 EmrB/QacA subfamily drug resistance transporter [Actinokineospora auranticolor]